MQVLINKIKFKAKENNEIVKEEEQLDLQQLNSQYLKKLISKMLKNKQTVETRNKNAARKKAVFNMLYKENEDFFNIEKLKIK